MSEAAICLICLSSTIIGAGIFAAGIWFRHRHIKPEAPAIPTREGNPWNIDAGGDGS